MQEIKNIIFDLGGVLLNIDYHKTTEAFKKLGFSNFEELFSQFTADELFEKLETGKVSEDVFYQSLLKSTDEPVTIPQLEAAWNAMLLDFRIPSLDFLHSLKGKYNLFLLSNTNAIHLRAFNQILKEQTGKPSVDGFFSKSYYSHLIQRRKPYATTYEFVLEDGKMNAEETLFIDDSINNIESAAGVGIKTYHLKPGEKIEELAL